MATAKKVRSKKTQAGDSCDPVWQYVLVMRRDLIAVGKSLLRVGPNEFADQLVQLAKGMADIGIYHTAAELEPLAQCADAMVERLLLSTSTIAEDVGELRAQLETLTGWEH